MRCVKCNSVDGVVLVSAYTLSERTELDDEGRPFSNAQEMNREPDGEEVLCIGCGQSFDFEWDDNGELIRLLDEQHSRKERKDETAN